MEVRQQEHDAALELIVSGRLDSYWADHLAVHLRDVIQRGHHDLILNLSETAYLSSAGIRVFIKFYKQLRGINGSFVVHEPSPEVSKILEISGLTELLIHGDRGAAKSEEADGRLEHDGIKYEIYAVAAGATMESRVIGDPTLLQGCRFGKEQAPTVSFSEPGFAFGLGAFGSDFEVCRGRFGEFLTVAGAAAYLPTDGTNTARLLTGSR